MFNIGDEVYIINEDDSTKFYKDLYRVVEELPNNELVLFNLATGGQKTVSRFKVLTKYVTGTGDPKVDEKIKVALEHYTTTAKINDENYKALKKLTEYQKELHTSLTNKFQELVAGVSGLVDYSTKLEKKIKDLEEIK